MPKHPIDVSKLLKLLMLTQSSTDAEALGAIRAANAYLKSIELDWNGLVAEFMAAAPVPAGDARRLDPRRAAARRDLFETLDDVDAVAERVRRIVTRLGGR